MIVAMCVCVFIAMCAHMCVFLGRLLVPLMTIAVILWHNPNLSIMDERPKNRTILSRLVMDRLSFARKLGGENTLD